MKYIKLWENYNSELSDENNDLYNEMPNLEMVKKDSWKLVNIIRNTVEKFYEHNFIPFDAFVNLFKKSTDANSYTDMLVKYFMDNRVDGINPVPTFIKSGDFAKHVYSQIEG